MKIGDFTEKRRFKRLDLSLPTTIKHASSSGNEVVQQGVTINVCFNGAYVVNINIEKIKPEDILNISLQVPRDNTRDFPFSRLTGKAKVVRVEKDGIAVEFKEDINRLFVATSN